jgi:hypothetical protein
MTTLSSATRTPGAKTGTVGASSATSYLELYLKQELLMAELYQRFHNRYAAHKDFWESMIADEREHAGYLDQFRKLTAADAVTFSEGKLRLVALNSIVTYVQAVIDDFDHQPFPFRKALAVCLDLEKSVLEREVFNGFATDSAEFRQVLEILRGAQEAHLDKVKRFHAALQAKAGA